MILHYLNQKNSILKLFLNELRDINIQKNSSQFRDNLKRIGAVMAYEMSQTLSYQTHEVNTPLGTKSSIKPKDDLVVLSILRAGLALHQGFIDFVPNAQHGFFSAYRHHTTDTDFDIRVEYKAMPSLEGKIVWLVDPMLATGQSLVAVLNHILLQKPKAIHLAVVVAAPEGIEFLQNQLSASVHLWIADEDDCLNDHQYIVPGLGDAGDLAYGEKI